MAFNGSGVFLRVRNWVADAAAGIKIRADYHDAEDDGFAAGLSNCITKDGQTTITQNIPFNSKRITGLGDPVNPQDAATKASAYAANADKVLKAGDTMTGDLTVSKSNAMVAVDTPAGGYGLIAGKRAGAYRWAFYMGDAAPEGGSNTGSNFYLGRFADNSSFIDYVLSCIRSTGLLTVKADPTDALGIATKQYVDTRPYHPLTAQLFPGIPPNAPAFPYTTVATDAQKMIMGVGTLTLPANGAVTYPLGTCISFLAYGGNMTITCAAGETLYWNDGFTARTGARTLGNIGMATAYRATTNVWVINGSGLS